jgi:hypothetical protein
MLKRMIFLVLVLPGVGGCIWPRDRGSVFDEGRWGYEEGGDWHAERRMGDETRDGGHEERAGGHEEREGGHEEREGEGRSGGGEHSGGHR